MKRIDSTRLALAALLALVPLQLVNAAQRTFVSTSGDDSNACSLAAPCRSFDTAITATDASGEIIVLDSGGYGRVTIDRSLTINAPPGVYAGISVFAGTNGIDVTAAGIQVALRGLTINGQGGFAGVSIGAASTVDIERCTIAHMTAHGIDASVDGVSLSIKDSSLHDNGSMGVNLVGALQYRMERVRVERNGEEGVNLRDGATGAIAHSVIAGNSNGGVLFGVTNGATMTLALSRTRIHDNALMGVLTGTSVPGGTLMLEVNDSVVSGNVFGGIAVTANGGGTVVATVSNSEIAHNGATGLRAQAAGVTLNLTNSTVVSNTSYGLEQASNAVFNSLGDNVVRDNNNGGAQRLGVITPIARI